MAGVGRVLGALAVVACAFCAAGLAPAQTDSPDGIAPAVEERGVAGKLKQQLEKRKLKSQQKSLDAKIERAELGLQMRQQRLAQLRAQTEIRVVGPDAVQVGDQVFRGRRAVRRAQRAASRPRKELGKLQREIDDYTAKLGGPGGPPRYGDPSGRPVRGTGLLGRRQEIQDRLQSLKSGPPRARPAVATTLDEPATPASTPAPPRPATPTPSPAPSGP